MPVWGGATYIFYEITQEVASFLTFYPWQNHSVRYPPEDSAQNTTYRMGTDEVDARLHIRSQKAQPDDAGEDQKDADPLPGSEGIVKDSDAGEEGPDDADAGPYRIAKAQRDPFQRLGEQIEADRHAEEGQNSGDGAAETVRFFERDGPKRLKQTGHRQIDPIHGKTPPKNKKGTSHGFLLWPNGTRADVPGGTNDSFVNIANTGKNVNLRDSLLLFLRNNVSVFLRLQGSENVIYCKKTDETGDFL